ncbi:hypothetical protein B0I35DRAFT_209895 [Stachybotrys elegans]|uniref:Uncharacterized protein n=1 Tax=Stachybotrys elegans TaxID=80388 RepID=A0A8K0SW31_9HYPO|nr:hypothetical protein B0I35DRAFT_209895 [Stachybotrys elegans]
MGVCCPDRCMHDAVEAQDLIIPARIMQRWAVIRPLVGSSVVLQNAECTCTFCVFFSWLKYQLQMLGELPCPSLCSEDIVLSIPTQAIDSDFVHNVFVHDPLSSFFSCPWQSDVSALDIASVGGKAEQNLCAQQTHETLPPSSLDFSSPAEGVGIRCTGFRELRHDATIPCQNWTHLHHQPHSHVSCNRSNQWVDELSPSFCSSLGISLESRSN